ncbi:hypothetical protein [Ferrimonas balearica]|uniref:hypothetical protein n=1 Tax=Ferrimonas balearica TaxID=44012 RepID=UPI001C973766|nr:hypothetical protein [Ferrimonas balearica]MBY5981231.1 hypothetical protein [Ferrimonas balearica]
MSKVLGYEVEKKRNYGFTHTSAEAVQQVKFMRGDYTPHEDAWRLIARDRNFRDFEGAELCDADLYVVEISSFKKLMLGEDCIQLNYLYNEFSAFFADKARSSQYWRLASDNDQAAIDAYLEAQWSDSEAHRDECDTLRKIRRSLMSDDEILADIRYLINNLNNVLFITHVDARKPDGEVIASRSRLINAVSRLVQQEGGMVYDPTPRMLEAGQENAIEDHSDSLAHFTEDFGQVLVTDWYNQYIGAVFDRIAASLDPEAFKAKALPHYAQLIEFGHISGLDHRLSRLIDANVENPELFALLAEVNELNGESGAAVDSLQKSLQSYPDHLPSILSCCELLIGLGRAEEAAEMAESLLAKGGNLGSESLFTLASLLKQVDLPEQSARYALMAVKVNHSHAFAANLLVDLALSHPDKVEIISTGIDDVLKALVAPARLLEVGVESVQCSDEDAVKGFIQSRTGEEVFDYLKVLSVIGRTRDAALVIRAYLPIQPGNLNSLRQIDSRFADLAKDCLDKVESLETLAGKSKVLADLMIAFPQLREVRIANRSFNKELINQVRQYYRDGDIDALDDLNRNLTHGEEPIFELPFLRSRLLFSLERFDAALTAAEQALDIDGENLLAQVLRMRSASRCDRLEVAASAARKLIAMNEPDSERLQEEARLLLERIPSKALVAARSCDDMQKRYGLLMLAAQNSDLAEKVELMTERLKRDWVRRLVAIEKSGDEDVIDAGMALDAHFPGIPRVQLILGRNLVKRGQFAPAKIHWLRLLALEPQSEDYRFQVERCEQRASTEQA